jgi:hypothetical protein
LLFRAACEARGEAVQGDDQRWRGSIEQ